MKVLFGAVVYASIIGGAVLPREWARAPGDDGSPAIIAGEWTLVERLSWPGGRVVVAYRNHPSSRSSKELSDREQTALLDALDGVASKAIAIKLGVSEATVSRLIARALRRLGFESLGEAAALRRVGWSVTDIGDGVATTGWAALGRDVVPDQGINPQEGLASAESLEGEAKLAALTQSERHVLTAILEGRLQRDIAAARCSSPRTVANQVASIFRKLGVSSRRELIARILGPDQVR